MCDSDYGIRALWCLALSSRVADPGVVLLVVVVNGNDSTRSIQEIGCVLGLGALDVRPAAQVPFQALWPLTLFHGCPLGIVLHTRFVTLRDICHPSVQSILIHCKKNKRSRSKQGSGLRDGHSWCMLLRGLLVEPAWASPENVAAQPQSVRGEWVQWSTRPMIGCTSAGLAAWDACHC